MTWRFITRKYYPIITDWRQWWKEVSSRRYEIRILAPEMEIMKETPWSRIRDKKKKRIQRILGDCWQWESNGQCSRGDNCSFRHDINKRGKMTQSNTSPKSFMQQDERNTSRTRSPRGKNPSGRKSRWPCKDYQKGSCTNSFCESGTLQNACSTGPRVVVDLRSSARVHIVRLMNNLEKKVPKEWW